MFSIAWLQLLTRIMSDEVVGADAAYLVGQTKNNASSVLKRGAELWKDGLISSIAILGGGEGFGYCGYDYSVEKLVDYGCPHVAIEDIPYRFEFGDNVINTLTELITVVRYVKIWGWQRLYLVASPFHQLRSFITAVTVADREYPGLKIYNAVGAPLQWNATVVHSQGVLTGTRLDLIEAEVKRILAYQQNSMPYPLVSTERAFAYLVERDRTV
ncbi:MAG: hypothetical protein Q7S09_03695 [bacterium]|nr:hypothetical protein [bacterium]